MTGHRRSPLSRIYEVLPPATFWILTVNVLLFLIDAGASQDVHALLEEYLPINYSKMVAYRYVWQPFTYMFMHFGFLHLFFNMLLFVFIGKELEGIWGTRRFLQFYFLCGVGAGVLIFLFDLKANTLGSIDLDFLRRSWAVVSGHLAWSDLPRAEGTYSTVGASGAISGVLLAYCLYYPEREILLFFVIPVKMKYFIIGSITLTCLFILIGWPQGISHVGHLGGAIFGALGIYLWRKDYSFRAAHSTLAAFLEGVHPRHWFPAKPEPTRSWDRGGSPFRDEGSRFTQQVPDHLDENRMTDQQVEAKIDELLGVISKKGLKGLKIEEQLFLDRVARLYRHKFPD